MLTWVEPNLHKLQNEAPKKKSSIILILFLFRKKIAEKTKKWVGFVYGLIRIQLDPVPTHLFFDPSVFNPCPISTRPFASLTLNEPNSTSRYHQKCY